MKRPRRARRGEAYRAFWIGVTEGGRRKCVLAQPREKCAGPLDAHHVLPKQRIKREFPSGATVGPDGVLRPVRAVEDAEVTLDALLADARNGVPVCRRHHDLLEGRRVRLPRRTLDGDFPAFLATLGLGWWEEKQWPT